MGDVPTVNRIRGGVTDVTGLRAGDHPGWVVPLQAGRGQQHAGSNIWLGPHPELVRHDLERTHVSRANVRRRLRVFSTCLLLADLPLLGPNLLLAM